MADPSIRRPSPLAKRPANLARPGPPARVIRSEALFAGAELLLIEHRGLSYCLRQTRLGKLILTK